MEESSVEKELKKIRAFLWYERFLFFPIKLTIAYFLFTFLENGVFFVLVYLLFCMGEFSARAFVNVRELNATIQNTHESLSEFFLKENAELAQRLEELENKTK